MVFFQAALLGGYAYAHATTAWLGPRRQALLHLAVLALPLPSCPLGINPALMRGGETSPVLDVLLVLSLSVGLPFFVVSATRAAAAEVVHRTPAIRPRAIRTSSTRPATSAACWRCSPIRSSSSRGCSFADSGWLSQTGLWTLGYVLLAVLVLACALVLWRRAAPPRVHADAGAHPASRAARGEGIDRGRTPPPAGACAGSRWPSCPRACCSAPRPTSPRTSPPVPLLWVLPLAIYLLSFILAFGRWPAPFHGAVVTAVLPVVLLVIFLMMSGFPQRIWVTVFWHLLVLLVVALACHGELALDRPSPRHLTEFYLLISVGGVLGGLFNALVAPLVFSSLVEYPLVMVLACVLLVSPPAAPGAVRPRSRRGRGAGPGPERRSPSCSTRSPSASASDFAFLTRVLGTARAWAADWLEPARATLNAVPRLWPAAASPPCFLQRRPAALGLALAGVLVVVGIRGARNDDQIRQARSFFGVLRVARDRGERRAIPSCATAPRCTAGRAVDPERARRATLVLSPRGTHRRSSSPSWIVARARAGWRSSASARGPWPPTRGPATP